MVFTIGQRYREAEPVLKKAIDLWQQVAGPDDARAGMSLHLLAIAIDGQGRYAEAERICRRVLAEVTRSRQPPDLAFLSDLYKQIGLTLKRQGKFAEAEKSLRQGLAIEEQIAAQGGNDLAAADLAAHLCELASLVDDMDRLAEAEGLYKRALAICEATPVASRGIKGLVPNATEAGVRYWSGGRRVLHLACHGLADHEFGNFYGALALAPGAREDDASDDGFLTLAEIHALDLKTCELAILSACETNLGPQQQGEGTFALSRGFLIAGARRVVASDWLVDDEAAASLMSVYCGRLARDEKSGRPADYARSLRDALGSRPGEVEGPVLLGQPGARRAAVSRASVRGMVRRITFSIALG